MRQKSPCAVLAACLALLSPLAVAGEASPRVNRFAISPIGLVPLECAHLVPSGAKVVELPSRTFGVRTATGHVYSLPACPMSRLNKTLFTRSAHGVEWSGWRVSAVAQSLSLEGFDTFRFTLRVPNLPKRPAAPLVFSAALQNQPFLPLAGGASHASPRGPFGHFGVVAQFPGDAEGWAVSLRLSTRTSGHVFTTARAAHPGDRVDVAMHRAGPRTWVANATVRESGEHLRLLATNPRLQVLPWATLSVSGGDFSRCEQLPNGLFSASNVALLDNGKDDAEEWTEPPTALAKCPDTGMSSPSRSEVGVGRTHDA